MCSQCIKFEAQRSPFFEQLCEVCAEICKLCVVELSKYEQEDDIFPQTINAAKVFAEACIEVVQNQKKSPVVQQR